MKPVILFFRSNLVASCFLTLSIGCASLLDARKDELANVFVDAQAMEDYRDRKVTDDGLRDESYHIMEGRHFVGTRKDSSLDSTGFQEIAEKLRIELRARRFFPARDFKDGDLLLVIHWGITDEDYDPDDPQNVAFMGDGESTETDVLADPDDQEGAVLEWTSQGELEEEMSKGDAALRMLGFDRAMKAKGTSLSEEKQLTAQMHGDRYFIVVNAYDWQKKINEGVSELLWVTRFSVDSVGTNFEQSFPALLRAARDYYGVELDRMVSSKTNFGEGEVKMGDVEVLDSADEAKDIK